MAGVKGKSGPRYKPTRLKELSGTLRADRVNPNEATLPALDKAPRCPSHIQGEARKTWQRVGRLLTDMGVLTAADLDALEAYVVVHTRWRDAETQLGTYGVMLTRDGQLFPSPYLRIAEDGLKQIRAWMTEFGITPSSRSRVSAVKKERILDPDERDWFGDAHRN